MKKVRLSPRGNLGLRKRIPIARSDENIVRNLIEEWPTAQTLSWDELVRKIKEQTGKVWTRQALSSKSKIKAAFQQRKIELKREKSAKDKKRTKKAQGDDVLLRQLQNAKETIAELEGQLEILRAQFIRWQANAVRMGVSIQTLDQSLQQNDRGRSDR